LHNNLKRIKTAIFFSGRGSNMETLIKATKKLSYPASILLVITNNQNAKGIEIAKKYSIPVKVFDKKKYNKVKFETNSIKELLYYEIELICLAGFMQVLSKKFINKWKNRVINIHPSYLPKNKGLNPQKQALESKSSFSGCTVHYVNEKIDSGKIILQEKVKIIHKDNIESLSNRILLKEHIIYPKALKKIALNLLS